MTDNRFNSITTVGVPGISAASAIARVTAANIQTLVFDAAVTSFLADYNAAAMLTMTNAQLVSAFEDHVEAAANLHWRPFRANSPATTAAINTEVNALVGLASAMIQTTLGNTTVALTSWAHSWLMGMSMPIGGFVRSGNPHIEAPLGMHWTDASSWVYNLADTTGAERARSGLMCWSCFRVGHKPGARTRRAYGAR